MFFNSKYIIEFSLPKEEILARIEKSVFNTFPKYNGKYFKGKVFENGFSLELMGCDFPTFKGNFIRNKNANEYLELSVGIRVLTVLILFFALAILLFVILGSQKTEFYMYVVYISSLSVSIFISYRNSRKDKEEFFNYLKILDKECEIVSKTKLI